MLAVPFPRAARCATARGPGIARAAGRQVAPVRTALLGAALVVGAAAGHAAELAEPPPPRPAPIAAWRRPPQALPPLSEPRVPDDARRAGHHGLVTVSMSINEAGAVDAAWVLHSSRSEAVDAAVVAAFKAVRFQPALGMDDAPMRATLVRSLAVEVAPGSALRCSEWRTAAAWWAHAWQEQPALQSPIWRRLVAQALGAPSFPAAGVTAAHQALWDAGLAACEQAQNRGEDPLALPVLSALARQSASTPPSAASAAR